MLEETTNTKEDVMDIAKLNSWNWFRKEDEQEKRLPVARAGGGAAYPYSPLLGLHAEMDRLFENVFRSFGLGFPSLGPETPSLEGGFLKPKVDVAGSDKEYTITAELPGLEEKDVTVEIKGDSLVIRGEKRKEEKAEGKDYYRVERSYGSFQRVLNIPEDADVDGIKAAYRNGVITVTLPRKAQAAAESRRIALS